MITLDLRLGSSDQMLDPDKLSSKILSKHRKSTTQPPADFSSVRKPLLTIRLYSFYFHLLSLSPTT